MRIRILVAVTLTAILVLWLAAGCSDDATGPNTGDKVPLGEGRVVIKLMDAPGDYEEVNIEFSHVRVRMAVGDTACGWHDLDVDTTRVNLLDLTDGNFHILADGTVPEGRYGEVRLILSPNSTIKVDGVLYPLHVPSSQVSGLKLKHAFEVVHGVVYAITLDLDAHRSIVRKGNGTYKLKPVIRMTVDAMSGAIIGQVLPVDARARLLTTTFAGDTVLAWADTLDGGFNFPVLPEGDYDLEITPTAGAYGDSVIFGVPVAAGQTTDLGAVELQ